MPDEPAPIAPEVDGPVDQQAAKWLPEGVTQLAERAAPAATTPTDERSEPSPWLPEAAPPAGSHSLSPTAFAALDPKQLGCTVSAYCNELLDSRLTTEATETILSRFNAVADGPRATAGELLRLTRKTATDYARAPDAWRGLTLAARREECRGIPARIAARDGNTLAPAARADLDAHLDRCLGCQAIELRLKRAERAFTTTLKATAQGDPQAAAAEPAAAAGAAALAGPTRRHRLRRLPGWLRLAGAAGMLAALAALAVLLGTAGSGKHATTAVPASASTQPSPATSTTVHHRATAVKHRAARHHGRTHRPAKHARPRSAGNGASTPVASTSGGSSAVPTAPPSTAAPAVAVPRPAPAAGSGSTGGGGSSGSAGGSSSGSSSGSVSVTQQGSGLPAQSAPTQGIGSGGSSGSQH